MLFADSKDGESKKGYVDFESADVAEIVIKENDKETELGKLYITYYKDKNQRKKEHQMENRSKMAKVKTEYKNYNLYVKTDLKEKLNEKIIREHFINCGTIFHMKVQYINKEPTGVAYVCFTNEEDTSKAQLKCKELGWDCPILKPQRERQDMSKQYMPLNYLMYPQGQIPYFMGPMGPVQYQGSYNYGQPQTTQPKGKGKSATQKKRKDNQKQEKRQEKQEAKTERQAETKQQRKITDEMKNELGDNLYSTIYDLSDKDPYYEFKDKDDDVGRITGVILESFEFEALEAMIKQNGQDSEDGQKLMKVIREVYDTLKELEKQEKEKEK